MKKRLSIWTVLLSLAASCGQPPVSTDSPATSLLTGTVWSSAFYYYRNKYVFLTDSTGYSQDGQLAWSTVVGQDTSNHIPGDSILWDDKEQFTYALVDTTLTLEYFSYNGDCTTYSRVFYGRQQDRAFVSDYEYAYGREVLCLEK